MDQNISPWYIQDNTFVTLLDGRRVWSHGAFEFPDGYTAGYLDGIVPPADGSLGTSPDPCQLSFRVVSIPRVSSCQEPPQKAGTSESPDVEQPNIDWGVLASTTEEYSSQEPKQKAGPFEQKITPEKPRDPANVTDPPNLDPKTGYYRAFVRFLDGKKVSEEKLRKHLEIFGPLGPYISPSKGVRNNHSAYAEFKTYEGFKAAKAAGLHALGDVQVWVLEREDLDTRKNRRARNNAGAENGSPVTPSPTFGNGRRTTSQGLRSSQLTPIPTSPRVPNDLNAPSTFSSSPMGTPRSPAMPPLTEYTVGSSTAGTRIVSNPSDRYAPPGPVRNRADFVRDGNRPPGARRPSVPITTEERSRRFDVIGHRRGVSQPQPPPQPLSPLNPEFDHDAQPTAATTTTATTTVPGPLDQSVVGQYTDRSVSTGSVETMPTYQTYQQAYPENSGLQPSATGFASSFGGDSEQPFTQRTQGPGDAEGSGSNSQQQGQQQPQQPPRPTINGLDNDTDAFKDDCPIHLTEPCDCDKLFPDCNFPWECYCPRPSCNPPPAAAPPPPSATTGRTETQPQSTEGTETRGSYFRIPRKEGRKGIDIMTPEGLLKKFRRDDGRGGDGGKEGGGAGAGGMAA